MDRVMRPSGARLVAQMGLILMLTGLAQYATATTRVVYLTRAEAQAITGGTGGSCYKDGESSCGVDKSCETQTCVLDPGPVCPSYAVGESVHVPYPDVLNAPKDNSGKRNRKVITLINCKTTYNCNVGKACSKSPADGKYYCSSDLTSGVGSDGREASVPDGPDCSGQ